MPPPPSPHRPPDPLLSCGVLHGGASRRIDLLVLALPPDPLPSRGTLHCGASRRLDLLVLALMAHRDARRRAQEAVGDMAEHNRIKPPTTAEWKVFCGMKPSFGGLHMGLIRISLWVGLIRLVCTQGARVGPNQQIWIICTVTVENEHMVYIYVYI
jgi:hypothetical protein